MRVIRVLETPQEYVYESPAVRPFIRMEPESFAVRIVSPSPKVMLAFSVCETSAFCAKSRTLAKNAA